MVNIRGCIPLYGPPSFLNFKKIYAMKNKQSIYDRAINNGCEFECTCVSLPGGGQPKWDELMKGARHANKRKVVKIALIAGVIDEEQAKQEIKRPYYNHYNHFITKTHIIYVHSMIEHFIKVY